MKRAWSLGTLLLAACGPVATEFFGDPPASHELIGPILDTALVRNLDTDSIAAEGVRWAVYAAAESATAGRVGISALLSAVAASHESAVPDSLLEGDPALELWNRLSAQSPVQRMNIARADALTISEMSVDTVLQFVSGDSVSVGQRWLAIVSTGRAWLDPAAGLRGGEN